MLWGNYFIITVGVQGFCERNVTDKFAVKAFHFSSLRPRCLNAKANKREPGGKKESTLYKDHSPTDVY